MHEGSYFTYIMASRSHTLYIGVTGNLHKRVFQHKWKEHEGFTARYNCDRLVWFERYQDVHRAIAGTLGTRTGNATYVGLSVNDASEFIGLANLSDRVLQDTAQSYAGELTGKCPAKDHTNPADCMFVYYFARDCSVVKTVTGENNCFEIDKKLLPEGGSIVFAVRDYLAPGTPSGPDSSQVLPPVLIQVQ